MPLYKLFLIFTKIGAILLGGGYIILPILTDEFCEKRKLITKEELVDYFSISQTLPGIIAVNISIFVGYKLRGKCGAAAAIAGVTFVPFWTIVLLASVISKMAANHIVQSALWGVGIAVIALIILTVREIWQKTDRNRFFYLIFSLALFLLLYIHLSPVQVILFSSAFGIIAKKVWREKA